MNFDRAFFASLDFKVMTETEKMGFAGVSSPVPLIADNGEFLVIIDGNYAEIYDADSIENCNGPSFQIDNISELPY
jgi:hypothetical protein